jgi:hypothetical protein
MSKIDRIYSPYLKRSPFGYIGWDWVFEFPFYQVRE